MIAAPICRPICAPVVMGLDQARAGSAPDSWAVFAALLPAGFSLWRPQVGFCWQDTARTILAGIGDPVRVIDDLMGLNNAVAPSDAARGVLAQVDIGGIMRQHIVFDGSSTVYAISKTVTERTLFTAFDDDIAAGFKIFYGSGANNNILNVSTTTWALRVDGKVRVDQSGISSQSPRALVARADGTEMTLSSDDFDNPTVLVTPVSVTFGAIGASNTAGLSISNGKFFGGGIGPSATDSATTSAIRTFIGNLIGKSI